MFRKGIRLAVGSRLAVANGDALQGTQHLLTEDGRQALSKQLCQSFKSGAGAVCTSVNTSTKHLDSADFFTDYSRQNDLSYYEVGANDGGLMRDLQGKGYTHCVPRSAVSVGEKHLFCELLIRLAMRCAKEGRDAAELDNTAGDAPLIGATVDIDYGRSLGGTCIARQIAAAAKESPDFLVVNGCDSPEAVCMVAEVLNAQARKFEVGEHVTWKGNVMPDENASWTGHDIPAVILTSVLPSHEKFAEIAKSAAKEARIIGLGTTTVLEQSMLDDIAPLLFGTGTVLAAPSSNDDLAELTVVA